MNLYRLEWTDKRGGWHSEGGTFGRLSEKLKTLRCAADLWLLDEGGVKIETVGGCDRIEHPDDKRIKWAWWFDASAERTACR
jgi:hypothetical protein